MNRRGFLKSTGVAGILAAGRAPAFAQGTKIHLLRWNDFIPACDVTLREKLLPEAGKALGAEIQLETINANDLQSRITAAIQSGSGADIIMTLHNWPHLYQNGVVEVTDLAEWQAKEQGGFYPQSEQAVKDGCDEGGFAWDDTNNNRAFLSGEIAATLNGASIYIAAKRGQDKIKDDKGEPMVRDIDHFAIPNGPAGSWGYHIPFSHMLMKYSKNQKPAKDFRKWLHGKDQFGKWFEVAEGFSVGSTKHWERAPMWEKLDPAMKLYRTAAQASRMVGYAGPPNAKASEVYSKYIITDMYAKAAQGMKPEDAVKWAAGELKKIYG